MNMKYKLGDRVVIVGNPTVFTIDYVNSDTYELSNPNFDSNIDWVPEDLLEAAPRIPVAGEIYRLSGTSREAVVLRVTSNTVTYIYLDGDLAEQDTFGQFFDSFEEK